jgi:hypothetical protein
MVRERHVRPQSKAMSCIQRWKAPLCGITVRRGGCFYHIRAVRNAHSADELRCAGGRGRDGV